MALTADPETLRGSTEAQMTVRQGYKSSCTVSIVVSSRQPIDHNTPSNSFLIACLHPHQTPSPQPHSSGPSFRRRHVRQHRPPQRPAAGPRGQWPQDHPRHRQPRWVWVPNRTVGPPLAACRAARNPCPVPSKRTATACVGCWVMLPAGAGRRVARRAADAAMRGFVTPRHPQPHACRPPSCVRPLAVQAPLASLALP